MSEPARPSRVTTLELFFDLVFVFTITQVALIVEHHPSWTAAFQGVLELLVIMWMYGRFSWLTNTIGAESGRQRVVLLLGMAAFLLVSLSVPRAFEEDAVAFGLAYLGLNLVHLAGFRFGGRPELAQAIMRVAGPNLLACALLVTAGFVDGPARWVLWILAAGLQWTAPMLTRSANPFQVDAAHFGERHGLMIMIVLGESLISVALAANELRVTPGLAVGVLCGLAWTAAMWWCYFRRDDDRAADALSERGSALSRYDVPHIPMMAGVIGVAAGSRLSLPDLTHPTTIAAASLIGGGAALYLAGLATFRVTLGFADPRPRAVAAALVLAAIPVGVYAGAAQQLAISTLLVVAMLVVEQRREGRAVEAAGSASAPGRNGLDDLRGAK